MHTCEHFTLTRQLRLALLDLGTAARREEKAALPDATPDPPDADAARATLAKSRAATLAQGVCVFVRVCVSACVRVCVSVCAGDFVLVELQVFTHARARALPRISTP